ncbi:sperm-egg fusion protein LLCFC1 isoform X1 [Saccopteryx leptura]|uniref:sperm-egg fusion protein LLCFC1 isoform X1 n=1 Tax=Saccopteryx leptura TaxID=249018 RepID=UPI00339C598A
MGEKGRRWCRQGLLWAAFLATILLLPRARGVKPQRGSSGPSNWSQKENMPAADQNQEQFREYFVASSVGEMWQEVDMAQQEDYQTAENTALRNRLLSLALCFNLANVVVFL